MSSAALFRTENIKNIISLMSPCTSECRHFHSFRCSWSYVFWMMFLWCL